MKVLPPASAAAAAEPRAPSAAEQTPAEATAVARGTPDRAVVQQKVRRQLKCCAVMPVTYARELVCEHKSSA